MKVVLLLISCSLLFLSPGKEGRSLVNGPALPGHPASPGFTKDILPLLQKKCSPCHFPGGKMYQRMPFDEPGTIVQHAAGALKRFNDVKEKELVREYIANYQHH